MSVGLGGEAGEVQELLKKHVRDGREIHDDLLLELGDVLHYLTRIAAQFGMTLEQIMLANREKIERRHAKREAARRAEDSHA
nr:MazG nucleotide pyrophosphohydrolase domain-containing protein [Dyella lutea]